MTCNVGKTEQVIRIVTGVIFFLIGAMAGLSPWGSGTAYVIGTVALITGLTRFCPLWKGLGINTCVKKTW